MPGTVVFLLAALSFAAPSHPRTVLLADPHTAGFEQTLLRHMLMQKLATSASDTVWAEQPPSGAERRAAQLRRQAASELAGCQAASELAAARAELEELTPEAALVTAAKARQKWQRIAQLTGDSSGLEEALALLLHALLWLGAEQAAEPVLAELDALAPDFQPPAAWLNPAMQRFVAQARARRAAAPRRPLRVVASEPNTALFVDGALLGFDALETSVVACVPHLVWALGAQGQSTAYRLPPSAPGAPAAAMRLTMQIEADPSPRALAAGPFAKALAVSRTSDLEADIATPALRAMQVHQVLVLRYRAGELELTHLQVTPPERRRVAVGAAITTVREAAEAADHLLRPPPALVPVPLPSIPARSQGPAAAALWTR